MEAPSILSTVVWGAEAPKGVLQQIDPPQYLAIHHTTGGNTTNFSLERAIQMAKTIQTSHFERGFIDSGQQFSISRGGYALEGRTGSLAALHDGTYFIEGAHVGGHNSEAIGIECQGTYTSTLPPQILYAMLVHLSSYICYQYDINPENILPHRDFSGASTECCGDAFVAKLPLLRQDVSATLNDGHLTINLID